MSYTPFKAPLLGGLLGDPETVAFFSVKAEVDAMIAFEIALARACAAQGAMAPEAADAIAEALEGFEPDIRAIGAATARDGVIVPELVRQMRAHLGGPHAASLHMAATSQDLIDTSFILRIKGLTTLLESRLQQLESELERLDAAFGAKSFTARTRMQDAAPITLHDRIASWHRPLTVHREALERLRPNLLRLQFAGAAGRLDALGGKGDGVRAALAADLGIGDPGASWHTDRTAIAEFAGWLSRVTGSLGKTGQDIALMAQAGEVTLSDAGASSAMPHKQNPVRAEVLVTLARFNATLVAGVHHALVHEQERSGAAWTLEWMLLPQMAVATGAATRTAALLFSGIETMGA